MKHEMLLCSPFTDGTLKGHSGKVYLEGTSPQHSSEGAAPSNVQEAVWEEHKDVR